METLFYRYNPWWEEPVSFSHIIKRNSLLDKLISTLGTRDIIFLAGLRRIGKTTSMFMLIEHLINSGISPRRIFYISMDDYLLSKSSLAEITETFRKIHKIPFSEKIYLFFDEIAYQKDFEQQLKNMYDAQNVKIYASTSQSSLLKSRKAFITGRSRVIEILPLDFSEYLMFKEIKLRKADSHLTESYFEDFMKTGGIPEYVLYGNIDYLKGLTDDIIYKDIAARYNVRDITLLKDFFLLLMERSGKVLSINKIAGILQISPDTSRRYFQYFLDTFIIFALPRAGKTNERILSAKKIYAPDMGIKNIFTGFRDKGSIFENYVFLKIKHLNPSYVYKDGIELDFITENKVLIEVKYNSQMTDKQKKLFDEYNAKEKLIITNIKDLPLIENV